MELKPRIVHVFNSSVVSGPETLVLPAINELGEPAAVLFLKEVRKLAAAQDPIEYAKNLQLKFFEILVRSRVDLRTILDIRKFLKKEKVLLLHAHDVKASTYVLLASLGLPVKLVSTHHGVFGRPDWKTKLFERFYSKFILPFYDAVISVSTVDFLELERRGLPVNRLQLIFNGATRQKVSPDNRKLQQEKIRTSWGLDLSNVFVIGVVGRLSQEKRCDRILQVLKHLSVSKPEFKVLFFGKGIQEAALKEQVASLGLQDQVRWMGYSDSIKDELAGFDLLLSLSDAEGMPIVMIESGWAGTPVFSTAVGGVMDLIPSNEFGFTVPWSLTEEAIAKKLLFAMENEAIRKNVGENFQNRVSQEFSRETWLKKHRDLYRKQLDNV